MECNNDLDQCVCDIIRKIDEAQTSVSSNDCKVSCSTSIKELISHSKNHDLNTIPIMLICNGECDFFIGSGVFRNPITLFFECFQSPIFRVTKIINGDDDECCVKLELLQPQTEKDGSHLHSRNCDGVCSFFPTSSIKKFIRTGIYITVNLKCFCGIECLAPVNAEKGIPIPQKHARTLVFQEEICGDFSSGSLTVWEATHPGEYFEGTFQIFNGSSSGDVEGTVTGKPSVSFPPVPPGSTISRSVNKPTAFIINAPSGTKGKYCITLYKRVPA